VLGDVRGVILGEKHRDVLDKVLGEVLRDVQGKKLGKNLESCLGTYLGKNSSHAWRQIGEVLGDVLVLGAAHRIATQ
jgi:hypothetical protein